MAKSANTCTLDSVLTDAVIAKSFKVRHVAGAEELPAHVEFDFSGLTVRQILERYAIKTAVIDKQRGYRQAADQPTLEKHLAQFSEAKPEQVPALEAGHSPFTSPRASKDPLQAATAASAKMDSEQRKALLEHLKALEAAEKGKK